MSGAPLEFGSAARCKRTAAAPPETPLGEVHVRQHKNWQELKKPNSLDIKSGGDAKRKATFVAEPLERGYGLTLGNALRRVLLSSLQGAAITSIKIENVLHEFSSLAGVREDVTDIVLNVKQIALRMEGEGPSACSCPATGPAEVTAGDIAVSGDIEVLNKDLVICTSTRRDAQHGADRRHREGLRPGRVEPADRRADRADPDRLALLADPPGQLQGRQRPRRAGTRLRQALDHVETDGTVTPRTRWLMPRASCRTS